MDYYQILGVSETSSKDEIKVAYRKLAAKHHPDRGGDTAKFQEIQSAYDTLSDDDRRAEYDNMRMGRGASPFGPGPNIDDIFRSFGFSFGEQDVFGQFRRNQRRNPDIQTSINIELRETLEDATKFITINTKQSGQKTLEIKIPRGIRSGTVMKFGGGGESIFPNIPPGDLYLKVFVLEDQRFAQYGLDLESSVQIDCFDAILGKEVEVSSLSGKIFAIKIPPNTQQLTRFKISGEGLWEFQKDIKGNFYVKVNINIPINLTAAQIAAVQQIKNSL